MKSITYTILAAFVLLLATFAGAQQFSTKTLLTETEVATGTPVSVSIQNVSHPSAYLVIKTENETATASLVVTVYATSAYDDVLLCTGPAITTNTNTTILIGSYVTAAPDVDSVCDFPLPINVKFTFTTSGAGADFDVSAELLQVTPVI